MGRRIRIPVNTRYGPVSDESPAVDPAPVTEAVPPVTEKKAVSATAPSAQQVEKETDKSAEEWRDRALRLQAEMENYRKRQARLAEERILADRERLLRQVLAVADDLERALRAGQADAESLRQGVALTHQSLMRVLRQEGVEPIQAAGAPFDPAWHEAVGAVPHESVGAEPDTVVQVMQEGYRMGDRLLRPAQVLIAS